MHRLPKRRRNVAQFRSAKAVSNERKYPNIVELAVTSDGLELVLSKRVSELRSVPYVTVRPILRRNSAPGPENKLDEIPPPNSIASQAKAGRRIF
jgi:hypothetical protein